MAKTVVLAEFKAKQADEKAIHIETPDETFTVLPPTCWPDDFVEIAKRDDRVEIATAILGGPEVYERFVAAGGTAALLLGIMEDAMGAELGE